MAVELHLPDLPEVPLSIGAPPLRTPRPWPVRVRDALSSYLPLLMMAALALATWWLVNNSPQPQAPRKAAVSASVPDYTMRRFTVQRFGADGALRVQLVGQELRHFPESDRIEVDELDLRAVTPDGRVTTASARRAVSNGGASVLELRGGAVVEGQDSAGQPVQIRSEYLHALLETDVVRTDRPVEITQGSNRLEAAGLVYDGQRRVLNFTGPVRAVLSLPPR